MFLSTTHRVTLACIRADARRLSTRISGFRLPNMVVNQGGSDGCDILVLYHYPCFDGIFAALSAHLGLSANGLSPRFIGNRTWSPVTVGSLELKGHETVYLLDFAGPNGFPAALASAARRVVLLDHHKTAAEQLPPEPERPSNLEVELDLSRSGASIARDYFRPQMAESVARMVEMVEDGDLWVWRVAGSDAFYAGLGSLKLELDASQNPGIFDTLLALDPDHLIAIGKSILEKEAKVIAALQKTAFVVQLGGDAGREAGWGRCLAVRADDAASIRSRLGNQVAEESSRRGLRAIAAVVYSEGDLAERNLIKVSLREQRRRRHNGYLAGVWGRRPQER
eukprot:jgi/Botrbrau1/5635/Bobra.55_1s0024.1